MREPLPCTAALEAIEADPLDLPGAVLDHLRGCPACREARVHWLAQEEVPVPLVPAGYFEDLPRRILRKLPSGRIQAVRHRRILWAVAAGLALALGIGGYLAGRAQRAPLVQATLEVADPSELVTEAPFAEGEDPLGQLSEMSPEDAEAVLRHLEASSRR